MTRAAAYLFVLLLFATSGIAHAQFVTLQINGIPGESTQRPGEIDIASWQFKASRPDRAVPPSPKVSTPSPVVIVKGQDSTSPLLFINCMLGTNLGTITITAARWWASERVYKPWMVVTLTDAVIISYDASATSQGPHEPSTREQLEFSYRTITVTFVRQNSGEKIERTWNAVTKRPM